MKLEDRELLPAKWGLVNCWAKDATRAVRQINGRAEEPSLLDADGQPTFHTFWSLDLANEVTFDAERGAFEAFIDLVMSRLVADPGLHVYHYAAASAR